MPSWEKTLNDQDTWKITMFLSHMDKLPPGVQEFWKTNFNTAATTEEPKPEEKKEKREHH